jgi:hypothetical protein
MEPGTDDTWNSILVFPLSNHGGLNTTILPSTNLPCPFVPHYTNKVFCVLTGWFLKGFLVDARATVWDFLLTDFPDTSGVVLVFFSLSPSPTLPFPHLVDIRAHDHFLWQLIPSWLKIKNKLTSIPPKKKKTRCSDQPVDIHLSRSKSYQLSITDFLDDPFSSCA